MLGGGSGGSFLMTENNSFDNQNMGQMDSYGRGEPMRNEDIHLAERFQDDINRERYVSENQFNDGFENMGRRSLVRNERSLERDRSPRTLDRFRKGEDGMMRQGSVSVWADGRDRDKNIGQENSIKNTEDNNPISIWADGRDQWRNENSGIIKNLCVRLHYF